MDDPKTGQANVGVKLSFTRPPDYPLVAASILSADFAYMARDVESALQAGADLLHIDVMDGHFVGNLSMGRDMVKALRKHFPSVHQDVHLMVEQPDFLTPHFADAGANHITFHLEVCKPYKPDGVDAVAMIEMIHRLGMTAGMAVNPATPVQGLKPYLDQLDLVLIMSVVPGKSGQQFMGEVLPKTQWARAQVGLAKRVEMDGGISPQTAGQAVRAGADVLVTASALFGSADRASVVKALHHAK